MVLEVVAAVFCRDDRVLCLRRSASRSQAGLWEFPGGKVEVNETLTEALVREIKEELCVVIEVGDYLGENLHPSEIKTREEPGQQIRLHAFLVDDWSGDIELIDHDQMLWCTATQMQTLNWSAADVPFVDLLCTGMHPAR